jgi:hypothetical protein
VPTRAHPSAELSGGGSRTGDVCELEQVQWCDTEVKTHAMQAVIVETVVQTVARGQHPSLCWPQVWQHKTIDALNGHARQCDQCLSPLPDCLRRTPLLSALLAGPHRQPTAARVQLASMSLQQHRHSHPAEQD